jgi:ATP-dependent DNA helicase RecG
MQLSERQRRILDAIKQTPTVTVNEMAVTLAVKKRTLERELAALQKSGALKREGKDNNGVWVVIIQ